MVNFSNNIIECHLYLKAKKIVLCFHMLSQLNLIIVLLGKNIYFHLFSDKEIKPKRGFFYDKLNSYTGIRDPEVCLCILIINLV